MSEALRVITNPAPQPSSAASFAHVALAERIRRLQAEAKQLAHEQIDLLTASLAQIQHIAQEVALGGEAYPAGVREIARQLAEDSQAKARTLEALMARR